MNSSESDAFVDENPRGGPLAINCSEEQPLLSDIDADTWKAPQGLIWIEIGRLLLNLQRVQLFRVAHQLISIKRCLQMFSSVVLMGQ